MCAAHLTYDTAPLPYVHRSTSSCLQTQTYVELKKHPTVNDY